MRSPSVSKQHSLTAGTTWLVAAKAVAFAFTIAIPLLLVRRMPQHEFGLYKQIFLIINSAVNMLPLGFGMTAFYFLPREEHHREQTVFNIVIFTAGVSALFAGVLSLVPTTLVLLFKEPTATELAPWIGAIVVLWTVGSFLEIVTVANQEIKIATLAILVTQMSRAIVFLAAAIVGGTVRALVFAAVVQGVIQLGALMWYLETRFPKWWAASDLSSLRRQLAYSLPFGLAGLLYSMQTDLHNYFVSHRFGAATFAIYSVGCFQLPLFGILADSVGSVMIPRVSLLQHQQRRRDIVLLTARAMRKLAAFYFPAYAFLMVMRREFIVGLFTDRYVASVPVFAINLTLVPLGILLLDPIMRAHAEHRHFLVKLHATMLAGLTVALPMSLGRFGVIGAIALVVIFNGIGRAATLAKAIRILQVEARDIVLLTDVAKIGAAAAAAGLLTAVVRPAVLGLSPLAALAICGLWFSIFYAVAALAFGVVTPEERGAVLEALRRAGGRRWPPLDEAATMVRE